MDYLNQLSWGFTFNPTDEELICYLEAKAKNSTLPFVDPIIDFDVYTAHHPSQLHMQQRLNVSSTHLYFYVEKSGIGRTAGNGFWHANTGGTKVMNNLGEVIGYRTSLVYYMYDSPVNDEKKDKVIEKEDKKKGKSPSTKTNWIMNEFRLLSSKSKSMSSSKGPMWTTCKIGETGRTFGGNIHHQVVQPSEQVIMAADQPQQQQLQLDHDNYMGLMEFKEQQQYDQFQQQLDNIDENACDWSDMINNDGNARLTTLLDRCLVIKQLEQQQMATTPKAAIMYRCLKETIANQHHQLQQLDHGDGLDDDQVDNLGLSEDDLRCLLEHSNALQQYDDDDDDGIPEMLWLDEAQLACDEEGNLLNPRPTKRARL
ncbi:hypothetical protein Syun_030538 [Stephania yunnanensis]|uniref:NAC domain-containing protein n=1 Tax=Stephania yunnanensis TaxID=152371 RepID=A0AAP0DU50_9MAGN